ncbi:hypothetical protein KIK84_16165 [Curvibacter sp. CHRR-16]|nr:hypothetical protein [Curvibacter sp. CHRR-16]
MTNTQESNKVCIRYTDKEMWSEAQEFAYVRLSSTQSYTLNMWGVPEAVTGKKHLLAEYNVRARRISATYARFYLEKEEGGQANKKGRFYWMALAAFAAKTVACSLEDVRVGSMPPGIDQVANGLGKGNMWLFYDIAPWHWMHANAPDCLSQYEGTRSDTNLVPELIKATQAMPWAAQALPKIGGLKTNKHIHEAFVKVREIEKTPINGSRQDVKNRRDAQLAHLLAIAEHEQKIVLQPLIYEDETFAWWLRQQRKAWINWASPTLELVFAAACTTDNPELKSVAPQDTVLEDFKSRFNWITAAAKKFHGLMQTKAAYMEAEISTMASWVSMNDPAPKPIPPFMP